MTLVEVNESHFEDEVLHSSVCVAAIQHIFLGLGPSCEPVT